MEAVRGRLAGDLEELGYVQAETFATTSTDELSPSKDMEAQDEQKMGKADGLWCCFFRLGPDIGAVHSEPPQGGDREGMDRVFVNVVPGTEEGLATAEDAVTYANSIGYPVMLKASGGGGGIGGANQQGGDRDGAGARPKKCC